MNKANITNNLTKLFVTIGLVLGVLLLLCSCALTEPIPHENTESPGEDIIITDEESAENKSDPDAKEFSDTTVKYSVTDIPAEKISDSEAEKELSEKEIFFENALEELNIGFNNYGTVSKINNNTLIINHPHNPKALTQMYASNEFLNSHKIEFIVPENCVIQTFVPDTLESLGYVEDDTTTWGSIGEAYGYVWESSLKDHLGIKWEYGATIEILIDDTYTILINHEFLED